MEVEFKLIGSFNFHVSAVRNKNMVQQRSALEHPSVDEVELWLTEVCIQLRMF